MKIVGIVGWKDSGKTTIATKIINKLSSNKCENDSKIF